jgi:hypothetical protein
VVSREETNVRVPASALASLNKVATSRGFSRDETISQLITEHIERQEALDPDDRLTHVATLMRYPPPPGRGQPKNVCSCGCDYPLEPRSVPGEFHFAYPVNPLFEVIAITRRGCSRTRC